MQSSYNFKNTIIVNDYGFMFKNVFYVQCGIRFDIMIQVSSSKIIPYKIYNCFS